MAEQLLTISEVAARLGYSPRQIQRLVAAGRIRAVRVTEVSHWRVREDDLARFVASLETNDPTYRRLGDPPLRAVR